MAGISGVFGNVLRALLRALIALYRNAISPLIGPRCRFLPSCSDYAAQALVEHRLDHALGLIVSRLARCHPFGASGLDLVPSVLQCRCGRRERFTEDSTNSPSCPPSA